jgi:hypothetical protein
MELLGEIFGVGEKDQDALFLIDEFFDGEEY